jgi:hypothetical protein
MLTPADKLNDATGQYDQKVSVNGVVMSTVSSGKVDLPLLDTD